MTERFQAADGISLIVRWEKMKLAVTVLHKPRLARNGKLLFIRRADDAYLLKGKPLISPKR